ncbi:dTMP kinase [Sphaerisporangium rubeum]|uniref:dTMP kinase n=1 Tax=Sphaerisporangium rubeum TaxID=321317 RepID=A0A7X0M401_9ACTN|nr:dTMP kinase [Sphaerisporangium rubeum]
MLTKEPTPAFDLTNEERHNGLALAELLAADRAQHLRQIIVPALGTEDVVITDRYIASSMHFQVQDGLSFDQVRQLNADFILPDINIFMMADESSLDSRRSRRGVLTRFDGVGDFAGEVSSWRVVKGHMASCGVQVVIIQNNDDVAPEQTAYTMAKVIMERLEEVGNGRPESTSY